MIVAPATLSQAEPQAPKQTKLLGATVKGVGVTWNKKLNKWVAAIRQDYKTHHLGCFKAEEDAARAYDDARVSYGLPRVNFPDEQAA